MVDFVTNFIHANPLLGIALFSLVISLFITLVMKLFTNQARMKELREKQKSLQEEMKKFKNDLKKVAELQKEMFSHAAESMKHSFKPLLITFLPLILILGWANSNIAYKPINPGQDFSIIVLMDKEAKGNLTIELPDGLSLAGNEETTKQISGQIISWKLNGEKGDYFVKIKYNSESAEKEVIVTEENKYAKVEQRYKGAITSIKIDNEKIIFINMLGLKIGWLFSYIIFSLIFGQIFRKILKVY